MSQTKVQLIAPIGVVTATTLETTGVLTATTFLGDIAGTVTGITSITDNLNLGIITATSFSGDFTGIGSGLTGTPNVVAGVVTATKFVGNTPGTVSGLADGTNINAGIITATSFVGNLTGNAAGLSTTTAQLTLGIVTATSYSGSGANLSGVSAGPVSQQAVTANSSTTTIDLSSGNLIYMTQSADTTVAFANTEGNTDVVYLIRTPDGTARTLTWPSGFVWDGGSEPTLAYGASDFQVFKLTTRDNGATWYAKLSTEDTFEYSLWNWGANDRGQLGQNNHQSGGPSGGVSSPVQIPGTTWKGFISPGGSRSLAIKTDGTLWSWGYNANGVLATNNQTQYSSPTQIPGTTWSKVTLSADAYALSTKTNGTLWGWGNNAYGYLGQNNRIQYSSPVQVGSDTTWSRGVITTAYAGGGFKTDGTLWVWGRNTKGGLGLNQSENSHYSSPVQLPGTTWKDISGDFYNTMGTKTDGTLWVWGQNNMGQLGQGNRTDYSSPVQIPGTNWNEIASTAYSQYGIKTDGTLWSWGYSTNGQLGQNNLTQRSSPTQIPGTTWSKVRCIGYYLVSATKTDGTLWAWGDSANSGALGQDDNVKYSSPVQVPGNWTFDNTDNNLRIPAQNLAFRKATLN